MPESSSETSTKRDKRVLLHLTDTELSWVSDAADDQMRSVEAQIIMLIRWFHLDYNKNRAQQRIKEDNLRDS